MKHLDRLIQRLRMRKVVPLIGRDARLLDVGCADGVLYQLVPWVSRYVGVDPDAPAVASNPRETFVRDTFPTSHLGVVDRFDIVTVLAVLEHVPVEMQPAFAAACATHVVPGGVLAITVPSPLVDPILDVLKRFSLLDGMEAGQHYGFDPRRTPAIFEPRGFRLEHKEQFELGLNWLFVFSRLPDRTDRGS